MKLGGTLKRAESRSDYPDQGNSIGRFVRERRKAAKLTQGQLAELANVGKRVVWDLEQGKPTLRMDVVNAVLHVFGKMLGVTDSPRTEL